MHLNYYQTHIVGKCCKGDEIYGPKGGGRRSGRWFASAAMCMGKKPFVVTQAESFGRLLWQKTGVKSVSRPWYRETLYRRVVGILHAPHTPCSTLINALRIGKWGRIVELTKTNTLVVIYSRLHLKLLLLYQIHPRLVSVCPNALNELSVIHRQS